MFYSHHQQLIKTIPSINQLINHWRSWVNCWTDSSRWCWMKWLWTNSKQCNIHKSYTQSLLISSLCESNQLASPFVIAGPLLLIVKGASAAVTKNVACVIFPRIDAAGVNNHGIAVTGDNLDLAAARRVPRLPRLRRFSGLRVSFLFTLGPQIGPSARIMSSCIFMLCSIQLHNGVIPLHPEDEAIPVGEQIRTARVLRSKVLTNTLEIAAGIRAQTFWATFICPRAAV